MRRGLPALALIALGWIFCLNAGFFWDDRALVLGAPRPWAAVWTAPLWGTETKYYRPITALSLRVDKALFGDAPLGYHAVSLLWHLGACALFYALLRRRTSQARAALGTVIFGLHPVQGEAVTWIVARNDPMAAVGVFGVLLAADRARAGGGAGALVWVAMSGLFGSLSKETAILSPVLLVLWRFAWRERPGLAELLAASVGPVVALGGRFLVGVVPLEAVDNPVIRRYLAESVVHYLAWITVPWPLTSLVTGHYAPSRVEWVGAGVTLAGAVLLRRQWRWALPAIAVLAPTVRSGVTTLLVGERFLYLPLAFLTIGVVTGVPAPSGVWLRVGRTLGLAALGSALLLNNLRLQEWVSESTLLQAGLKRSPNSRIYQLLGNAAAEEGDRREAFRWWLAAVRADRPALVVCPTPVVALLEVNATEQALMLAEDLATGPCKAVPGLQRARFTARVLAGQDVPEEEVPSGADPRAMAVWHLRRGDLLSGARAGALWPPGPAQFRDDVFFFEHGQWPPS